MYQPLDIKTYVLLAKILIYLYINILNLKIFLINHIGSLKNLIFIFHQQQNILSPNLITYLKLIINE